MNDYVGLILYDELLNKIEIPVLHVVNGPGVAVPADFRPEEISQGPTETRMIRMAALDRVVNKTNGY